VGNTPRANTQIVASTTNPIAAMTTLGHRADTGSEVAAASRTLQLFVGGAGAEISLLDEVPESEASIAGTFSNVFLEGIPPLPVSLPSGSRLSAKCRSSNATATDRETWISILGLD